jgi:hypothetical protein
MDCPRGDNASPLLTWRLSSMARRTTHRSSTGKKLYAVRDRAGKFKDIQS